MNSEDNVLGWCILAFFIVLILLVLFSGFLVIT